MKCKLCDNCGISGGCPECGKEPRRVKQKRKKQQKTRPVKGAISRIMFGFIPIKLVK